MLSALGRFFPFQYRSSETIRRMSSQPRKRQNECWHRKHADALGPVRRQVGALDRVLELSDWPPDRRGRVRSLGKNVEKGIRGARSERAPSADKDVAIAGIGEFLLPVGEAGVARSGMIRFSL